MPIFMYKIRQMPNTVYKIIDQYVALKLTFIQAIGLIIVKIKK